MKKSFKIVYGFGDNDFVEISKNELAGAYYAMQNETKLLTDSGVMLRGKDIIRIEPNWNAVMGYNRGYKLKDEDYLQIGKKRIDYARSLMQKARNIAFEAIETGNVQLLKKEIKLLK